MQHEITVIEQLYDLLISYSDDDDGDLMEHIFSSYYNSQQTM